MSSCSSDSEDDLYTNTASIFQKLTTNININDVSNNVLDSTNEEIDLSQTIKKRKSDEVIDAEASFPAKKKNAETEIDIIENNVINLDESIDVIENINACLERNKRERGRRKSRGSPIVSKSNRGRRVTTRSRKSRGRNNPKVIASIEIDVDYPITNSNQFINTKENLGEEITVRVLWKSQSVERFELHRKQKLDLIFKHYAEKEKVSEELLHFSIKDKLVCKIDTPESLNLNAASIIEGGILSSKTFLTSGYKYDTIELKVQWKNLKKPFIFNMRVTDDMSVLMKESAKEMKVPIEKLKFYFDGEAIDPLDTPSSLQLEGGECIDCVQK